MISPRPWRQLTRGLRALGNPSATDRDIADEVQHYLEQSTSDHIARGLSPTDARRAAQRELGNVTAVREQVRGYGWENVVDSVFTDVRYATRRLRAAPGFTAIALLTLALGVGATTAIFSVVKPILFEPLPYPSARRLVSIVETSRDGSRLAGSFGMYRELVTRSRSFDAIAVLKPWQPTMTGPDQPERFEGQRVSASFFQVLGVPPAVGRDFETSDDRPRAPNVVILSDALWRRRFDADRAIIGRAITLDDQRYVVVGIMPSTFENVLAPNAALWAPLQYDLSESRAWGHHLRTVARLRANVSVDQATRELTVLGQAVVDELRPETYPREIALLASSLQHDVTRGVRPALLAILGAVSLVLIIACVNVTNLLLARGVQRRGEFALRAALGAGNRRLIRQLLTESLLLATIGGIAGIAAAIAGVRLLLTLVPPGLPRVGAIEVDAAVLLFGLTITTVIALAVGMLPGLQAARSEPNGNLHLGASRITGGHRRARGALVVAEIALALVLLVSSGLLLRSLDRLLAVPVGFDPSHLLTMQVQTSGQPYTDVRVTRRFFDQSLAAVRRVPGVTSAALTSQLPLSGDLDEYGVRFEGSTAGYNTMRYAVSPGYVETMGIPLRSGRALSELDDENAPPVALISESLARRRFPAGDAIGKRLSIGGLPGPLYTIVGVVADVKQVSLALTESDAVYAPMSQWPLGDAAMSLVVRARSDAAALAPAVREAVWSVDKNQPVVRVATMASLVAASAAERRFALLVFEAFALAALVLAAAGLYGVVSGTVAERTREIGVRSALGATRGNILGLVLRRGLTLTGAGAVLGLFGAAAASRAIAAMLFGVSQLDLVTYAAVTMLLGAVAVIASGVPAMRAARVDPASALRAE